MMFEPFPKVPRLSKPVVITEKIDGTNAQVEIVHGAVASDEQKENSIAFLEDHHILAGSRNRYITLCKDNFGFAAWVAAHVEELMKLGPGKHYGEWWGRGIQRGYDLEEKRFSLFNTGRWSQPGTVHVCDVAAGVFPPPAPSCCHVVPVLEEDNFSTELVQDVLDQLTKEGSNAAPGFMKPEGVMIYHTAANQYFKKTYDDNHKEVK